MRAADSSLIVAAFATWHERHEPARKYLDDGLKLIEHCALESYSVLTRLPAPHRSPGNLVRDFLETRFPDPLLRLSVSEYRIFLFGLPEQRVGGGTTYDALVAATAASHDAELVTCDRRAAPTYERYGVRVIML